MNRPIDSIHAGSSSKAGRLFDGLAMGVYPSVARIFGYSFCVGSSEALRHDAHLVLAGVWGDKGVRPPADLAWVGERYDRAATWIVAYHGRGQARRPVGVMGLLDMRVASIGLDCSKRRCPDGMDLERTREIGRLAILKEHRGGIQTVMVGLLREMLHWSRQNGIELLFSASVPRLFEVYRRFNPTAKLLDCEPVADEDPVMSRYFAPVREYGGLGVLYTFEVRGASPWSVFSTYLMRIVPRRLKAAIHSAPPYPR